MVIHPNLYSSTGFQAALAASAALEAAVQAVSLEAVVAVAVLQIIEVRCCPQEYTADHAMNDMSSLSGVTNT